jgi:uncharacterized protein YbjT (DUF2867 family)
MRVLLGGAHGRLGSRVLALLLYRGHAVRAIVRTERQADALRSAGADAVVGDLRGDIEWAADGCDATVCAAGARHRAELAAVDAGGAAKLADAAFRYEHSRFVLSSVIGADRPERRRGGVRDFLEAKHQAEQRVAELDMAWTILRFGRLTEAAGTGRIATTIGGGAPLTLSRDDAALAVVGALERTHLERHTIPLVDGDDTVAHALDSILPRELPPPQPYPTGRTAPLGAAQSDNPPDARNMIAPDAPPLDADVEWEGDGPVPAEPVSNEDPAPGIP